MGQSAWSGQFCFSTTSMLTKLYQLNFGSSSSLTSELSTTSLPLSKSPTFSRSSQLLVVKLVYYGLVLQMTVRGVELTFLLPSQKFDSPESVLPLNETAYQSYHPLLVVLIHRYPYMTFPIYRNLGLLSVWLVYFDNVFTYQLDGHLLASTYAMLVTNGWRF